MKYKYTKKGALQLGWDGLNIYSYSEKSDFERASAGVFEVTKHHGKVKSLLSDRIYFVLEGTGHFEIADESINVEPTDVIIVPRGTEYDYFGKMKLFLVHTPAYTHEAEVVLDDVQNR
jgi:mannose-6-phosphate isomerase-like protein (cupin superfamily)